MSGSALEEETEIDGEVQYDREEEEEDQQSTEEGEEVKGEDEEENEDDEEEDEEEGGPPLLMGVPLNELDEVPLVVRETLSWLLKYSSMQHSFFLSDKRQLQFLKAFLTILTFVHKLWVI